MPAVDPTIWRARDLMEHVLELYKNGELDEVYVIYTKMRNAISMDAEMLRILPLTKHMFNHEEAAGEYMHTYMPSPQAVLKQVVPNYAKGLIFGAMIEAYASEQNARYDRHGQCNDECGGDYPEFDAPLQPRSAGGHYDGAERSRQRRCCAGIIGGTNGKGKNRTGPGACCRRSV